MKITDLGPGNYYGSLSIKEENGKYFWCVDNWDQYTWIPIPKYLYKALQRYANRGARAKMTSKTMFFIGGPLEGSLIEVEGDVDWACPLAEPLPVTHVDYDPNPVGQAIKYEKAVLNGVEVMVLATVLEGVRKYGQ